MTTVGVVQLPGMMTEQILAGAAPLWVAQMTFPPDVR
jgi:ABC-type iron transport system FetAB permease component